MKLVIPSRGKIFLTSQDDVISSRYYNRLSRWVYRKRLQMALDLLGDRKHEKILDVGFGSGILEPSLSKLGSVTAIDIHDKMGLVREMVGMADYRKISLLEAPWKNEFDVVICMSVLEHMEGKRLTEAVEKLLSLVKNDGFVLVGVPNSSVFVKAWFKLNGSPALKNHKSTSQEIEGKITERATVTGSKSIPFVYTVYKVRRKK
ncbi:MAG: methyltransferase domain-containing protein [Candidatus Aenigmatarchaeota archaeon]